jgi:dTDP-4-amino-4,6-dideoxygalactose transaminase
MAAGVGPGDAVVTVAHTFMATVEAISQAGAATEFVDVDPRTYNMDPAALESFLRDCSRESQGGRPIGRRTGKPIKAIVPVHLYGQVADMDRITAIAERYGLVIVEDACQAHGAKILSNGVWRSAGTFGKAAAFSFYPGKNLGALGEGGAVTTDDAEIARSIRMLREHGQAQKYYHDLEGYNGRLDAIQAAFLRVKLRRLEQWNEARRNAARRYNDLLASIPSITIPFESSASAAVYHLYVIRTPERDALAEHLKADGIATGLHYPVPVHMQKCYAHWNYGRGSLPVTEKAATEILSLPMFPGLTAAQQDRVAGAIQKFSGSLAQTS